MTNEKHENKATADPQKRKSAGEHGGNRGGNQHEDRQPRQSSQAAGKDPHRGEKE